MGTLHVGPRGCLHTFDAYDSLCIGPRQHFVLSSRALTPKNRDLIHLDILGTLLYSVRGHGMSLRAVIVSLYGASQVCSCGGHITDTTIVCMQMVDHGVQ